MELKNLFFETSSQKGMIWQNKKNFDFLSLIFDSRNFQAAALKSFTTNEMAYVTFHGKTYTNAFPFNGLKRLLVVCLPLKQFRKSLEALERPLKFSQRWRSR